MLHHSGHWNIVVPPPMPTIYGIVSEPLGIQGPHSSPFHPLRPMPSTAFPELIADALIACDVALVPIPRPKDSELQPVSPTSWLATVSTKYLGLAQPYAPEQGPLRCDGINANIVERCFDVVGKEIACHREENENYFTSFRRCRPSHVLSSLC